MNPVDLWQGKRILVAGDPGVDHYVWGTVDRISPEAPVPVFVPVSEERRPGLASNVVANLEALGCRVTPLFPPKPWTIKTRYMVGSHQLLRVDHDQVHFTAPDLDVGTLDGIDAIVLSDYAKGWLSRWLPQDLIAMAKQRNIPVVVDPKTPEWARFRGATVICPNHKEHAEAEDTYLFDTILIKRGKHGIRLLEGSNSTDFPSAARQVFDVTGAGDTVCSVVAACLAAGIHLHKACEIANVAAGYVVGKVGTSCCDAATLKGLL